MQQRRSNHKIYNDTWAKIAGSLLFAWFIDSIGRPESTLQLMLQPYFYIDLLTGFIISFIIWEFTARIIYWLDRKYDWSEKTVPRIFMQFLFCVLVPSLMAFLLTFLLFETVWDQDIFDSWIYTEYPMAIVLILLVNIYYLVYYFYYKWKFAEAALMQQKTETKLFIEETPAKPTNNITSIITETKPQAIIVSKGAKNIPLGAEDIAYCYINEQYNYIKTFDEESYITSLSLDEIAVMLEGKQFFRANQQVIININIFDSFSNIENGKLQVHLKPPFKDSIVISQKKAKEFKEWVLRNK